MTGPSPHASAEHALAWFASRFVKACKCPPLDVRIEGQRLRCGKCDAVIVTRKAGQ